MVNIPTNYKMGSGLAATIMGQQAGLEAEQQGLANLYKASEVPKQMLQGAESMALLNDPDYIKANTQFQLAATQAKLGDAEKQTAVNGLDRLLIQLQANPDPQAQQQIILQSFREKGVDPTSPMGQAILADPYGKTMEARDKLASTFAKTPTHMGEMEKQKFIEGEHWRRTQAEIQGRNQNAQISAGAADARILAQEQREIKKARRGLAFKDPVELEQGLTSALNNGLDPITMEPLTPETRKYYETMRKAATDAVAKKQKTINFNFDTGTATSTSAATPAPSKSSAASEAESKGF